MLCGTIHAEYKKCGRPNCRCVRGALHGPFYYWHFRAGGRQRKSYIKKQVVPRALQQHAAECEEALQQRQQAREITACGEQGWRVFRELRARVRELEETTDAQA